MTQATDYSSFLEHARALHQNMLTVDTHCDTPSMQTLQGWDLGERHPGGTLLGGDFDLIRMQEGGLAAAFFAIFVAQGPRTQQGYLAARQRAEELLAAVEATFRKHPGLCERALSPEDARRIHRTGKRAIFLGMENGYPLGQDPLLLQHYYERGIRYLTLCHATDNDLCAACTTWTGSTMTSRDSADTGLTEFGARVVRIMNVLGMMVDISHTSEKTVQDVLQLTDVPVIASHSGARVVGDHPRNLSDDQLRAIAAQGGVVQVPFVPGFLNPEPLDPEGDRLAGDLFSLMKAHYSVHAIAADPAIDSAFEADHRALLASHPPPKASIVDVVNHIEHIARVAGIDHVGIGSDFDGGVRLTDCRDVADLPHLTAELLRRGHAETDIRKIWGENLLRVFDRVVAAAGERKP
jgi:membrane dipeptidase